MIRWILDTDTITLFQRHHPVVAKHSASRPADQIAATIITVEEQVRGWFTRLRRAKSHDDLSDAYGYFTECNTFLKKIPLVSLTKPAILRYEQLKTAKLGVAKTDLRIAAIALENNAAVVTRNVRDFQKVPALAIEDWTI